MIEVETRKSREGESNWLLVSGEVALYALVGLLAVGLRLIKLGAWPLLTGEASHAWQAWQLLNGTSPTSLTYSPLLFVLSLFNEFAFGASDGVVRFWPALFGSAMVLSPVLLKPKLGRVGALAASLMLAISPMFLYFSRTLDGSIVAAASALALLGAVQQYVATRKPGYAVLGAVALAFGIMSDASFYTFVAAALVFGLYAWWDERRHAEESIGGPLLEAWRELAADKATLRKVAFALVGPVVLLGSAMFLNIGGWQATLNVLGSWFGQFAAQGQTSWNFMLQMLAAYDIVPLVLGIAGLIVAIKVRDWFPRLLMIWFALSLVIYTIAGQRAPGDVLIVLVPLVLLGGIAVDRLVAYIGRAAIDKYSWLFLVVAGILFAYLYLQMVGFTFGGDGRYGVLAMVAGIGLVACFAIFWYWVGTSQALPVGATAMVLLFLFFQTHTMIQVNYYTARDPRELVNQSPTSTDILNLAPFLRSMSSRYTLDLHTLPILMEKDAQPVVSWYTRDFVNVDMAQGVPTAPDQRAVIMLASEDQAGPAQYIGQPFRLYEHAQVTGLGWGDWAKWFLRRYEVGAVSDTNVEVWIRP